MNIVTEIFYRFTYIEISSYLLILIATGAILAIVANYTTKDRRVLWITSLGLIFSQVTWIILTFLTRELLNILPTDIYWIAVIATLFVSVLNLTVVIGEYSEELSKKGFDIDHIGRRHFSSTLNLSVLLLLSTASVIFIDPDLKELLITIVSASIGSIWFNHLLVRYFLKESE